MTILHQTIPSKTGKLEDIPSLNTSVLNNSFCSKMRNTESVCKKCYAATMEKMYANLHIAIAKNDDILSKKDLLPQQIPTTNSLYYRFNAFGELINEQHLHNFNLISLNNPKTTFTLWTKRKDIIARYYKTHDIPNNFLLVFSSTVVGKIEKLPKYFNKVFTAHSKKQAVDTNINCFGKCKDCLLCYTKNDITFINEILK